MPADASINTIIGAGSTFKGNLDLSGFVRIDGDVDGRVTTAGRVFVGPQARIHGDVTAEAALIGGIVLGNIEAPHSVKLFSTAAVIGDIATRSLEVADGVILQGHCIALHSDDAFEKTVKDWQASRAIRNRAAKNADSHGSRSKNTDIT